IGRAGSVHRVSGGRLVRSARSGAGCYAVLILACRRVGTVVFARTTLVLAGRRHAVLVLAGRGVGTVVFPGAVLALALAAVIVAPLAFRVLPAPFSGAFIIPPAGAFVLAAAVIAAAVVIGAAGRTNRGVSAVSAAITVRLRRTQDR